ncbi:MAG: DUF4062 domain-containing protein [Ignavibacteriales bacterium]|nr:DUF4062 domain-containing protein [Ignavibacteriales bacterium]
MKKAPPTILVSSTVHRIEDLLDQVYGVLGSLGYKVWMSHKGTIPVHPRKSNFQNCLIAAERCDLFFGIITPFYGSGKAGSGLSITHQEMLKAIKLDKLRWFVAHHHVDFARKLLRQYRFFKNGNPKKIKFSKTDVMDDLRVLDMYEAATRDNVPLLSRTGNWVQPYVQSEDVLRFITAQFGDLKRIEQLIEEQKAHAKSIKRSARPGRNRKH